LLSTLRCSPWTAVVGETGNRKREQRLFYLHPRSVCPTPLTVRALRPSLPLRQRLRVPTTPCQARAREIAAEFLIYFLWESGSVSHILGLGREEEKRRVRQASESADPLQRAWECGAWMGVRVPIATRSSWSSMPLPSASSSSNLWLHGATSDSSTTSKIFSIPTTNSYRSTPERQTGLIRSGTLSPGAAAASSLRFDMCAPSPFSSSVAIASGVSLADSSFSRFFSILEPDDTLYVSTPCRAWRRRINFRHVLELIRRSGQVADHHGDQGDVDDNEEDAESACLRVLNGEISISHRKRRNECPPRCLEKRNEPGKRPVLRQGRLGKR